MTEWRWESWVNYFQDAQWLASMQWIWCGDLARFIV
jgi:hypothetical protein